MSEKRIEIVRFDGDELQVLGETRDDAWVVLRSGCEALGLSPHGQAERLKRTGWACTRVMRSHDASGRIQEMFCVHLDTVPMWLATIEASRVRPEVREKLERYQREAARVLAEHFMGARGTGVIDVIPAETKAVIAEVARQITEPILAGIGDVKREVGGVKQEVAGISARLTTLEEAQAYRRKRIPESIKRRHEEFARAVMPKCLPCGAALFDGADRFIGEHHHIEKASNATLEATMPVCPNCNKAFNLKPMPRHFAETYHERMRVWSGPLFAMVGKA